MKSGELKSWLETIPVLSQNNCGALNVSEVEIKSAARRRVRKSRGEQAGVMHSKTARSDNFAVRMNGDGSVFTPGTSLHAKRDLSA
jgi:hypothetical protein